MDLIIQSGTIVTESNEYVADIAIQDGRIVEIASHIDVPEGCESVDARGKLVLPGGVDVHTHMDLHVGGGRYACDDWFGGTRAAVCGGTTSVIDHMAFGPKGCTLRSRVEDYHERSKGKASCDYSFHGVVAYVDDEILAQVPDLLDEGIDSAKMYMTYADHLNDEMSLKLLRRAKELGIVVCVHAENHEMVETLRKEYAESGQTQPIYHAKSRPVQAEAEAVDRILRLASLAGDAPIYIVHLSTKDGLEVIREARRRGQKNIFAETCPQYLALTEDELLREDGLKFIFAPPLRTQEDIDGLWEGIINREIQTVATDHCPFTFGEQKQAGKDDFRFCPNGIPGVEERLLIMIKEGVATGKITWSDLVRLCMSNPARVFGLAPHKGFIEPGADADLLIVDPHAEFTITQDAMHGDSDYTCYEGWTVPARIERVYLRGQLVARDNEYVGTQGQGEFLRREAHAYSKYSYK